LGKKDREAGKPREMTLISILSLVGGEGTGDDRINTSPR
jgi:hypothetical protein